MTRYLQSFSRVAVLLARDPGQRVSEMAFHVGLSERVVREYIALYEQHRLDAVHLQRIEQLVERVRGGLDEGSSVKGGRPL